MAAPEPASDATTANASDSAPQTSRASVDMDICDENILAVNPVTLSFKAPAVEGEYLADVAKRRWPVLIFIFSFDILCFTFRLIAKCIHVSMRADGFKQAMWDGVRDLGPQLANMGVLHCFLGLLNLRSRRHGRNAALQEEVLLSACMAAAICSLLAGLRQDNAADYVYAAFFLICTSTFMKIRWWVGTATLLLPTALVHVWQGTRGGPPLPEDAVVHMVVAWAVGGLMAYLADWYRRQMFANQKLVGLHHQKEILEAQARIKAQRELVEAQAQAAARALIVAREKAANEAKSEFMSLMCHEVRTPLNGCLASAEMLLETPLQEEQRELANTIRISGSILLSTVSNFLDFFKMEAGKRLDIVRAPLATADLVTDVHCIIEAMIGRNGDVQLLDPDLSGIPPAICGDADRLRGILLNLYTNAAKFTKHGHIGLRMRVVGSGYHPPSPPGYSSVTVTPSYCPVQLRGGVPSGAVGLGAAANGGVVAAGTAANGSAADGGEGGPAAGLAGGVGPSGVDSEVSGGEEDGPAAGRPAAGKEPGGAAAVVSQGGKAGGGCDQKWLLFEVEDTGVGITDRGLKTLFREYVQGAEDDLKTPRSKGGTGLGLSICSKQVGVLGGRIGAHSAVGRGSVFWFTIPLIDVPPAEALRMPRAHSWASHSPAIVLAPPSPTAAAAPPPSTPQPCPRSHSENNLQALPQQPPVALPPSPPTLKPVPPNDASPSHASSSIPHPSDPPGPSHQQHSAPTTSNPPPATLPSSYSARLPLQATTTTTTTAAPPHLSAPPPLGPALPPLGSPLKSAASSSDHPPSPDSTPPYSPHPETHDSAGSFDGSSDDVSSNSAAACAPPNPYPPTLSHLHTSTPTAPSDCTPLGPPAALHYLLTQAPSIPHPLRPGTSNLSTAAAPAAMPSRRQSIELRRAPPAARGDWSALGGRRVLLAEDNLINQTVARKMLTSLGLQCEVVSNGLEAVKAVERALQPHATPIDVVLMDMAMPIMGGLDATRAIRDLGAKVPIVAMTANAADKDRDECLAAGMDGFLSKPVLRERLAEAIGIVLSGRAWFQDSPLPLKAFEAL